MQLEFELPAIVPQMVEAKVLQLLAKEGDGLAMGAGLVELEVDLSSYVIHDCPPISYFRIVLREAAWLRRFAVTVGETVPVGRIIAQLSTTPDESLGGDGARRVRVNVAGVIPHWDEIR